MYSDFETFFFGRNHLTRGLRVQHLIQLSQRCYSEDRLGFAAIIGGFFLCSHAILDRFGEGSNDGLGFAGVGSINFSRSTTLFSTPRC